MQKVPALLLSDTSSLAPLPRESYCDVWGKAGGKSLSIFTGTGFVSERSQSFRPEFWMLVLGIGEHVPQLHNPTLFACLFLTVLNKALPPVFFHP